MLLYHIERPSARAHHAVGHMLRVVLGWSARHVADPAALDTAQAPCLVYGDTPVSGAFRITPCGMLEQGAGLLPNGPPSAPFQVESGDMPHDPFAGFFLRSTLAIEDGLPQDRHQRTDHNALMDVLQGTHLRPLVEEWAFDLAERWRSIDTRVPVPQRTYRHIATMDVDNGFMYLGREAWRTVGGAMRDLLRGGPALLKERIDVLLGRKADPYDIYALFRAMTEDPGTHRRIVNFLVASRGTWDHAVGTRSSRMRDRMREVAAWAEVGVHPSYHSMEETASIDREKRRLEAVIGRPVSIGRQHFLRFAQPGTQRALLACGIREEHSVGFSDGIGFRAATCTPFHWFDRSREASTELLVVPFQIMDSAMAYRMRLDPDGAIAAGRAMVDVVRQVQGTLSCVWHERFLSDHGAERGWQRVVRTIIQHAARP